MKILGRTTRCADLAQCVGILRDRILYDDADLRELLAMWQTVIVRDVGRSAVVFEESNPSRVLAFGVSAAVDKALFDRIVSDGAPFIGKALLDEWRAGNDPFLDEASFASANANGGLYFVVMHNGVEASLDESRLPTALVAMSENFLKQHAGTNMSALIHESYGVPPEFATGVGMSIVPYASTHHDRLLKLPVDRRPMLNVMTRDHAQRNPGIFTLNQTFLRFTPPRCTLRAAERQMLRFALEGVKDDEIAQIFSIAPQTLKKRWANIYVAMEPVIGVRPVGGNGGRGVEIRPNVLRYVREHPEELHAYAG